MFSGDEQDYELQMPIGYGASAVVYKALYKPIGQLCAVKVINVDKMPLDGIDRLRRCCRAERFGLLTDASSCESTGKLSSCRFRSMRMC